MPDPGRVGLGDAVTQFLTLHPPKDAASSQPVLQRFIRWCGRDKPVGTIKAWEIENFGQNSGADSLSKLAAVKAFLAYAFKEGMTLDQQGNPVNLGTHLKVKRAPVRHRQAKRAAMGPTARLSAESFEKSKNELEQLKSQRVAIADEIKLAMADKDFRENAPLDASRDKQAHLEARIRELEQALQAVEILEENETTPSEKGRCRIGSKITVKDMTRQETFTYILVDPNEVDLANNKISVDSPVGRAFLNKKAGEVVEVKVPAGSHKYKIEGVDGFSR